MGARRSKQMEKAVKMLLEGKTAYEAAKKNGLAPSAVYQTQEYKDLRDKKKKEAG